MRGLACPLERGVAMTARLPSREMGFKAVDSIEECPAGRPIRFTVRGNRPDVIGGFQAAGPMDLSLIHI